MRYRIEEGTFLSDTSHETLQRLCHGPTVNVRDAQATEFFSRILGPFWSALDEACGETLQGAAMLAAKDSYWSLTLLGENRLYRLQESHPLIADITAAVAHAFHELQDEELRLYLQGHFADFLRPSFHEVACLLQKE